MSKHRLEMPRIGELNEMSNEELQTTYASVKSTYMTDKANTTRGMNPPAGRMREGRKTIARILTIMRKRGIAPNRFSPTTAGDDPLPVEKEAVTG